MSYLGLNLLFNLAVPIALATIAQMLVIAVNDLDLSIGTFVSFAACVTAVYMPSTPLLGIFILAVAIAAYAFMGMIIHLRDLPSIVVTLGMSFVWGGLAVLILPSPGGQAPVWLRSMMTAQTPIIPFAIVASLVIGIVAHLIVMKSTLGVAIRGVAAMRVPSRAPAGRCSGSRLQPMHCPASFPCWRAWRWWV